MRARHCASASASGNWIASNNVAAVQVVGGGYNVIRKNDLNGNRGWGLRLMNSPHNRVEENVANNNNRSCWSGVNSGCESAGLAMVNSRKRESDGGRLRRGTLWRTMGATATGELDR